MGCVLNKLLLRRSHNASKKYEVGNIDEKTAVNILDELFSSNSSMSESPLEIMTEYPKKKKLRGGGSTLIRKGVCM